MTQKTFERLVSKLTAEVMQHPNKDELLKLLHEQMADDTFVLISQDE